MTFDLCGWLLARLNEILQSVRRPSQREKNDTSYFYLTVSSSVPNTTMFSPAGTTEDESGMSLDSSVNMSSVGVPGSAVSKADQQYQQQPPEANSPLPPSLSDRLAIAGGATADGDGAGENDGKMRADENGAGGSAFGDAQQGRGGSNTTTTSLVWNVEETRTALREATSQLGRRGLKLAAKWAAEQVVGLPPPRPGTGGASQVESEQQMQSSSSGSSDLELHAKTLLECGEYRAAASTLSGPPVNPSGNAAAAAAASAFLRGGASVRKMRNNRAAANRAALSTSSSGIGGDLIIGPPLEGLSPFGTYLRAYSLYMAGERRKEEEVVELRCVCRERSLVSTDVPLLAHVQMFAMNLHVCTFLRYKSMQMNAPMTGLYAKDMTCAEFLFDRNFT